METSILDTQWTFSTNGAATITCLPRRGRFRARGLVSLQRLHHHGLLKIHFSKSIPRNTYLKSFSVVPSLFAFLYFFTLHVLLGGTPFFPCSVISLLCLRVSKLSLATVHQTKHFDFWNGRQTPWMMDVFLSPSRSLPLHLGVSFSDFSLMWIFCAL